MKVGDIFRRDIRRQIEEVVKVDLGEEEVVTEEIDEYVATEHILEELERVLEAYQETIMSPSQTTNIWVSGFFGSGKSAWAKTLGYLLENPTIGGRSVAQRFFEGAHAPTLQALCNTVYQRVRTVTVFLNLATGSNVVAREGESVVLPVYRALLDRFGYSRNILLAELEWWLEGDGRLGRFEELFEKVTGKAWKDRRYSAFARNEASRALHELDGQTFPQADSWSLSASEPVVDANFFAQRALDMLARRGEGANRIVFVVDEAGQYVARSVQRVLDLQGLAEACQVYRGRLWVLATSQERLQDVVDSLESTRIELARVQERFPIEVDLLPSDIEEVTSRRVLEKTEAGGSCVRAALVERRNQLAANTRLVSPTRAVEGDEEQLVRLYPLLPYQIQLIIDAVSARRAQGGGSPTVGGSNRTLIKHAQSLLVDRSHGLADEDVGVLVTLDRSYDLLEEIMPTSWRAEVDQVADKYGGASLETKATKVIALCSDVRALPLTSANIAVLLHPHINAESLRDQVTAALENLVSDDRVRETGEGFRLQSPEQKDWERDRRGIDLTPGQAVRLRRELLRQALSGLSVSRGRTFPVSLYVEREKMSEGQLLLAIEEAEASRRQELRRLSREQAQADWVTWAYEISPTTWDALRELHRSRTMIERRDTPTKSAADAELLGEERERARRTESHALARLTADLASGQVIFRGEVEDLSGGELRPTAQKILSERLGSIYPRLAEFDANVRSADALAILRADDLGGLPDVLGDNGLGLLRTTPQGAEIVTTDGPLATLVNEVRARASYGQEATGAHLERYFGAPPFGARVEVLEVLCAAGIRAGVLEAVHQGQRVVNAGDRRLDQVFGALPRFRAAAFRPPAETEVPLEARVELAERLEQLGGGRPVGMGTDALAKALRSTFAALETLCVRVEAALQGAGIDLPDVVVRTSTIASQILGPDDVDVVTSAHSAWVDLVAGRDALERLDELVTSELDVLREAVEESLRPVRGLPEELAAEQQELRELLAAGDLVGAFARIKAISARLRVAREEAAKAAAGRLAAAVEEACGELKQRADGLEPAALAEVMRPLEELVPSSSASSAGLDAASLDDRLEIVPGRKEAAARRLEELQSAGRLAWVEVSDLVGSVITDEEGLEGALDRIREAVAAELASGKQVRLR